MIWSYVMKGHAKRVERCFELSHSQLHNFKEWQRLVWTIMKLERDDFDTVSELAEVCAWIASKCVYLC